MGVLANKVAIVTGATAGIGEAVAVGLAEAGASVVVTGRRAEKLDGVVKGILGKGGKALGVVGDASDVGAIDELVKKTVEWSRELGQAGRVDILVANAGRGLVGGLLGSDEAKWEEMYELNVLGAAHLMRRAAEIMVKQKSGDIVALGSVAGHHISPFSGFYGSTKFAVAAIAEALRREICGQGVRVTTIKPAVVLTEFQEVAGYNEENFGKAMAKFGKVLVGEDVARAMVFILSQPGHVHINEMIIRPTGQDYP